MLKNHGGERMQDLVRLFGDQAGNGRIKQRDRFIIVSGPASCSDSNLSLLFLPAAPRHSQQASLEPPPQAPKTEYLHCTENPGA